jgi:hypothetical protein
MEVEPPKKNLGAGYAEGEKVRPTIMIRRSLSSG